MPGVGSGAPHGGSVGAVGCINVGKLPKPLLGEINVMFDAPVAILATGLCAFVTVFQNRILLSRKRHFESLAGE